MKKCFGNLFWGMQFRTCKNFWEQQTTSLVLSQKIFINTKPPPQILEFVIQILVPPNRHCENLQSIAVQIRGNLVFRHCEIPRFRVESWQSIKLKNVLLRCTSCASQ